MFLKIPVPTDIPVQIPTLNSDDIFKTDVGDVS